MLGRKTDITEAQLEAADVNNDGTVNSIDFAYMRQLILGLRQGFE